MNKNRDEISLSFDDDCEKTSEILKVLKKHNVKASFFVVGNKIKRNEKIIREIIRNECEIGNHRYSHVSLRFKNKNFIKKEILKTDFLLKNLGIETNLFRPPYFRFGINLWRVCLELNKKIIFADVFSKDYSKLNKEIIVKRVLNKTKRGSIINFHDFLEGIGENIKIVDILEKVIPKLKEKYKFIKVSGILK